MSHPPTNEQQAIIDAFGTSGDLVVEAGAGTGKTSTLRMLAHTTPGQRGIYIAYNRSIATEASQSFPASVLCKTAHGLAYGAVGKRYRHRLNGPRVPAQRSARILGLNDPIKVGEVLLTPKQQARLTLETVTRFCYSSADTVEGWHVPLVAGLDKPGQTELARYLAPVAQRAWDTDLTSPAGQLRYQHDHYLKEWILSGPQLSADYVLLDEAQDSNGSVAGLVAAQDAQKIWVGDRCQSIYKWRGAWDAMQTAPGKRLYLSQSFRFGPAIAAEANKWLTLLHAPLRLSGHDPIASRVKPCPVPDAILCRSNAGAMDAVMHALAAGRQVALVGDGQEIRRFAEAALQLQQVGHTDHPELFAFGSWAQVLAYVDEAGQEAADLRVLARLVDKHNPGGLLRLIDALVDEQDADLTVSTAHKSKGREWHRVQIGDDFTEPKPDDAGQTVVDVEESMLAYVAVTRARKVLDRGSLAWVDQWTTPTPVPSADPPQPTATEPPRGPGHCFLCDPSELDHWPKPLPVTSGAGP